MNWNAVAQQHWRAWAEKFHALQEREQLLVVVAALALVIALCDWLLWSPQSTANQQHRAKITELTTQLDTARAEHVVVSARLTQDPNAELRANLDTMQARIAVHDQQLAALTVDLISPQTMAAALREILLQRHQLQLIELQNTPAVPAFSSEQPTNADAVAKNTAAIYRHGLTLRFKGRYFDVIDYLQALEQLRWHFYWQKLDYKVGTYPEAEVTLTVYTLSAREDWIGA